MLVLYTWHSLFVRHFLFFFDNWTSVGAVNVALPVGTAFSLFFCRLDESCCFEFAVPLTQHANKQLGMQGPGQILRCIRQQLEGILERISKVMQATHLLLLCGADS